MVMNTKGLLKVLITHDQIKKACEALAVKLVTNGGAAKHCVWGIPRGGVCAMYALLAYSPIRKTSLRFTIADHPSEATLILDDLVDTCRTRDSFRVTHPNVRYAVLFDKFGPGDWIVGTYLPSGTGWLQFPWEHNDAD